MRENPYPPIESGSLMKEPVSFKIRLRRIAVYLKYSFPAICTSLLWLFCALPLWQFNRGDGETRVYQSLLSIVSKTYESSQTILSKSSVTENDVSLAKSLVPSVWIFWIILGLVTVLSLMLLCFSLSALPKNPTSPECNRIKVWFKFFFPGQLVQMFLPLLTIIPLCEPYYIAGRFEKYYGVSGTAEGVMGTEYTYFSYSVATRGINPIVILAIFVILALIAFVFVIPYQRSQKLDMYTYFEPEPEEENSRAVRRSRH